MKHRCILLLTAMLAALTAPGEAQEPSAEVRDQIAGGVAPAPEDLRDGATVLGYGDDGRLITLRDGDGDLLCLADDPRDERFHVACYHKDLDPFMARGRELRAQDKGREDVQRMREEEIEQGTLAMPSRPTALYSLTGPDGGFDPLTGDTRRLRRVYVVYMPYATAESTGLSPMAKVGAPWIMSTGKPWAHIMLVEAPAEEAEE